MIIDYISDLHLDHHVRFQENHVKWKKRTCKLAYELVKDGNADVLIIAGDISEWSVQTDWFLNEVALHYNKVFIVLGNHDYYLNAGSMARFNSLDKLEDLRSRFSKICNLTLLEPNVIETYKGKVFAGDTLWYFPYNHDVHFYLDIMPDSKYIKTNENDKVKMIGKLHEVSMDWYNSLEHEHIDVFVSHVPPVHNPKSPFSYNACFSVQIPFLISEHWVVGHQHTQHDFKVANTNFYMNPMGYVNENKWFGLKSFEI